MNSTKNDDDNDNVLMKNKIIIRRNKRIDDNKDSTDFELYESWTLLDEPMNNKSIELNSIQPTASSTLDNQTIEKIKNSEEVFEFSSETPDGNNTTDIENHNYDEDDGISVISENNWNRRCNSYPERAQINKFETATPPNTPEESDEHHDKIGFENIQQAENLKTLKIFFQNKNLIVIGMLAGLAGILLGQIFINYTGLSNITPLIMRIKELEVENIALKTEIREMADAPILTVGGGTRIFPKKLNRDFELNANEPIILSGINEKRPVWTGGNDDQDQPIIISPSKNIGKFDFCKDTENIGKLLDDLFHENICEQELQRQKAQREKRLSIVTRKKIQDTNKTGIPHENLSPLYYDMLLNEENMNQNLKSENNVEVKTDIRSKKKVNHEKVRKDDKLNVLKKKSKITSLNIESKLDLNKLKNKKYNGKKNYPEWQDKTMKNREKIRKKTY